MSLTLSQIDELERAARSGSVAAVRALAAAAREYATDEPLYRIETEDGLVKVVTAREYLSLTATDLARTKIHVVAG